MMIFSVVIAADAQEQERPTCPSVVRDSLNALGTNCATLTQHTSCYGHEEVQHTSFDPVMPPDFYTVPGDRSDLYKTETIQTGPFSLAQEIWGLNIMNVNANLPFAFSPRGAIFVQFGGVEVENGVEPFEAVTLIDGFATTTTGSTELLSWPPPSIEGHASELVVDLPTGAPVSIDAINPAGNYVRAVFEDRVGWINLSAVDTTATGFDLAALPEIGPDDMTPMQDFYFRTGIGGLRCDEAPSLLFIQGPNTAPVDIRVHDHHIRIESSVILRSLPPGDQLGNQIELFTISGLATIHPDTPGEILVPPGFFSTIPLCPEFESLGIEGDADEKATCGNWSLPAPGELGICEALAGLPDNLLYYAIGCPTQLRASTVSPLVPELFFPDPAALDAARAACAAGDLPVEICEYLGIS
jgi:hypothetical protein